MPSNSIIFQTQQQQNRNENANKNNEKHRKHIQIKTETTIKRDSKQITKQTAKTKT